MNRHAEFRPWLDARIASGVLMCNAGEIIDWNYDKRYLQEPAASDVSLEPSGNAWTIRSQRPSGRVVV